MLSLGRNICAEIRITKVLETLVPQGFLETFGYKIRSSSRPKTPAPRFHQTEARAGTFSRDSKQSGQPCLWLQGQDT